MPRRTLAPLSFSKTIPIYVLASLGVSGVHFPFHFLRQQLLKFHNHRGLATIEDSVLFFLFFLCFFLKHLEHPPNEKLKKRVRVFLREKKRNKIEINSFFSRKIGGREREKYIHKTKHMPYGDL